MAQSLAKILVHTVFSTKDRRPFLRDKTLRDELHRYLGGILGHDLHLDPFLTQVARYLSQWFPDPI